MGLMVPLDQIKLWLGIAEDDDTKDEAIEQWGPVVTEWMEAYCNRGLEFIADVEEDVVPGPKVEVFRFPLVSVAEMSINGAVQDVSALRFDKVRGIIHLGCAPVGADTFPSLHLKYTGGFNPVPVDLAQAYSYCIAGAVGVVPKVAVGGGSAPLKSLSLGSGALSVAFDTGSVSGRTGAYDVSRVPPQLQPYAGVLDNYRVLVF